MGTEKVGIVDNPFIGAIPPFVCANSKWNDLPSTWSSPSQSVSLYTAHSFAHEWLALESFTTVHSNASLHPYLQCTPGGADTHTIPVDRSSCQDTRSSPVHLDTSSPGLGYDVLFPFSDGTPLYLQSLDDECRRGSNGFVDNFASGRITTANIAPKPQVTPHTGYLPEYIPDFRYHHASLTTYHHNQPSFHIIGAQVSSSSTAGSTEEVSDLINSQRQSPVVLYRPPERHGSSRRRLKRACAFSIDGMWIDKEDLCYGAGQDSITINVHKCLWTASNDPCGMWIIGSRSRVAAHIRNWHTRQRRANSTVECLWGGCTKTMLKDSINRHIVTVHLGEGFHCQGCNQVFPRKDVYNQHVEDNMLCRDVGVVMVYGAESKVIDTHQALHRGTRIRHAGQ